MKPLAVLLALAALAAPAHAADAGLETTFSHLVAGPDGGAWIGIDHELGGDPPLIGHATPDGTLTTVPAGGYRIYGSTLGPDGRAWFNTGAGLVRVDAALTALPVVAAEDADGALATSADGRVWLTSGGRLLRVDAQGNATGSALPGCENALALASARASDGAMWLATQGCGVVRVAPDGTAKAYDVDLGPTASIAADGAGGAWFTAIFNPVAGHIDAAGAVLTLKTKKTWYDVAVGPDGNAYFAGRRCALLRATPTGVLTAVPVAIPAAEIAFDPFGGQWLASDGRLAHNAPAAGCDDRPPRIGLLPARRVDRRGYGVVKLSALRRAKGFELRVPEPVAMEAFVVLGDEEEPFTSIERVVGAGKVRIPFSKSRLRGIARRHRPRLDVLVDARDRDGNGYETEVILTVIR
jgi:streptogramin lyase